MSKELKIAIGLAILSFYLVLFLLLHYAKFQAHPLASFDAYSNQLVIDLRELKRNHTNIVFRNTTDQNCPSGFICADDSMVRTVDQVVSMLHPAVDILPACGATVLPTEK